MTTATATENGFKNEPALQNRTEMEQNRTQCSITERMVPLPNNFGFKTEHISPHHHHHHHHTNSIVYCWKSGQIFKFNLSRED